jgi:acyl carrier protein
MHLDQTTHERIRSFIQQTFPAARKSTINDESPLLDSGIVDSLGTLDVVAFMERAFGIEVADDDLVPENFASISALASFVQRKTDLVKVPAE